MTLKFSVRLAEEAAMSLIKTPEEKSGCEEETRSRKVGLLSSCLSGRSPRDSQIKVTSNRHKYILKRYRPTWGVF